MTYDIRLPKPTLAFSLTLCMLFSGIFGINHAFADTENDFVSITSDKIKNDPMLAQILENIEKSKQQFSDLQEKSNQDKFIDEQRTISMNVLEKELKQMFKDNEEFTSVAAFNKFLKKISDDDTKHVFQGLFDYKQDKISSAKKIMNDVLKNGGSLQDARNAYHDALQIPRSEMINLVKDLNIQSGFSDVEIQKHFDSDGKLPRYEDVETSIISFVNLTTTAENVNSSVNQTSNSDVSLDPIAENVNSSVNQTSNSVNNSSMTSKNSDSSLIQQLLDEISFLKNKIELLEKQKDFNLQQAVFEKRDLESKYFANWVADYHPGKGHYAGTIAPSKSIPVNALNYPNSYDDIDNSLSLGRQGQVTLGFSAPITDKLIVYETTNSKNLQEIATIEVSDDGENWILLKQTQYHNDESHVHQYGYDLSNIGCISHVRITDTTVGLSGDGFDVDGIGATKLCNEAT